MILCDAALCTDCAKCIKACPQDALKFAGALDGATAAAGSNGSGPAGSRLTGGGWSSSTVRDIQEKARTGKHLVRGCGTTRKLPTFDDLVLLSAGLSRMPVDTYREDAVTRTVLGARYAKKPLVIETPIMVAPMSYGALSKEAKIALAMGSAKVGTAMNNGEGGLLPEERAHSYRQVVQVCPSRFGFSLRNLEEADAIELVFGIGAKPGLSGHLMAEKMTAEIAAFRGLPPGIDLASHPRHGDIFGADDLVVKLQELREITNYEKPIFLKVGAGRVYEDVKIAAKVGVDGVVIDGMQGGTGAGPKIAIDHLGMPTLAALVQATRALEDMGVKDEVSLMISGGIRDGADIAKALALGADAVYVGTGAMVAMGCTVCLECHKGECEFGIGTQKLELRERLNIKLAAHRVANYFTAMTNEMVILAKACGKSNVHNLEREDLRAVSLEACAMTGIPYIGSDYTFTEPFGFFG
ncbi:MAG: FMN-binding glutamate synthase family protein [Chloroflexi bacterium]|nr:FMN-binding glutamate synthase family protein [Chloroflexota bacterium]